MARKDHTITVVTDDLTGKQIENAEDAQEIHFSYGGTDYVIDLHNDNAKKLDDLLAPYIDAARRAPKATAKAAKTEPSKEERNAMREWAVANGHKVSDRGRIAQSIQEAYRASLNS